MAKTASALHILVKHQDKAEDIIAQLKKGAKFQTLAKKYSTCPSGKSGGDLGSFGPGMMVPEFDKVCFNGAIGVVHGPVQTQFGYHLLEVTERSD